MVFAEVRVRQSALPNFALRPPGTALYRLCRYVQPSPRGYDFKPKTRDPFVALV